MDKDYKQVWLGACQDCGTVRVFNEEVRPNQLSDCKACNDDRYFQRFNSLKLINGNEEQFQMSLNLERK